MNDKICLRIWLCLLLVVSCSTDLFSQGFNVKEFKQNLNDGSAFHAPMDAEGHPCGLIKVRTDNSELQFKGDIIGDVENKMNEYWAFVSTNCRFLKINHPNFMPFMVSFSDYGIDISSKATYILTLEETKYKKEKTELTIIVKPENADLYIDDTFIDNLSGNGFYQLYLPKGEHICKLSKAGYSSIVQTVLTGKTSQNISVELESVMAELEVRCKTATAEIYIDDELKGNGIWKGELIAGEHKIEARQQNFNSHSQTVTLAEKESRAFAIPELKRSMGIIKIETIPSKVTVIVDGKDVGLSPCEIECETGPHYITINAYGCTPYRNNFEVVSGKDQKVTIVLEYTDDNYKKAYNGNVEAIDNIIEDFCGQIYRGNSTQPEEDSKETVFWLDRHPHPEEWLTSEIWIEVYSCAGLPEKALELFPIIRQKVERNGNSFPLDLNMSFIGHAFLEKKEYDKAIDCYLKAVEYDEYGHGHGLEGLGDCYAAMGDKQRAATYYKKCISLDSYIKSEVEKKLKELGY